MDVCRVRSLKPEFARFVETYRAFVRERLAQPVVERWLVRLGTRSIAVPSNLEALIRTFLAERPAAA